MSLSPFINSSAGFRLFGAVRREWALIVLVCASLQVFGSVALRAETLNDALSSAYQFNPDMHAAQAQLRATDENVARAQSGYRPDVTLDANASSVRTSTKPKSLGDGRNNPYGYSVTLKQPLFRGFRTVNGIRQAKASVQAGRASLLLVEQAVLLDAVTAYMNLVQEGAVLRLQRSNVEVLTKQLTATNDRFTVGEVTTTDVAQARASRSAAISSLNLAMANLTTARAQYRQIIGHQPNKLRRPGTIAKYLPKSQAEAVRLALGSHPSIEQAIFNVKAARHNVNLIIGERLPEVSLEAQFSQNFDSSAFVDQQNSGSLIARATVPLYQGGELYARIRQAKQQVLQQRAAVTKARLLVQATVISAWGQLDASRAQVRANRVGVRSNKTALSGVREEEKVGQRTVLDVLDAEQDYLNSQVVLVQSERDVVVAEYNLLSAVGQLYVSTLPIPTPLLYDPVENYAMMDRRWRGASINFPELDESRLFLRDDVFTDYEPLK